MTILVVLTEVYIIEIAFSKVIGQLDTFEMMMPIAQLVANNSKLI